MRRKRRRDNRTYVLLILGDHINNLSGTDGLRAIGRTFSLFLLKNFSQAEMIYSYTNTLLLNPCMSKAAQIQIPTGKYLLLNGRQFFIALTRVNRLEKWQVNIVYCMKLYGALFLLFISREQARESCIELALSCSFYPPVAGSFS